MELELSIVATEQERNQIKVVTALKSMLHDEEGAAMVEYGLLVALIAMVALVGVTSVGKNLKTLYTVVAGSV